MIISLHVSAFCSILLACDHASTADTAVCISPTVFLGIISAIVVSSTYFQLQVRAATFKSFIINKKSQGQSLVSEIRRRCSLRSSMGFCFGRGTTSARFQEVGGLCSLKLAFNMGVIGFARISAYSRRNKLQMPSGPAALRGFSFPKKYSIILSLHYNLHNIPHLIRTSDEALTGGNIIPSYRFSEHWDLIVSFS